MDTKLNINAIEELSIPVTKLKDPENLTTGFANDLTGRNEATAEEFTFRPSAGNISIRDDSATIKRIKGNSIVWNQLVYPTKWNTDSVNGTVNMSDDYSEITHISAGDNNIAYIYASNIVYPSREGHIMYFYAEVSKGYSFYACKAKASDGLTYSPIVKVTNDGLSTPLIAFYKNDGSNFEAGEEITIKNVVMFDLTQMFGAGNEPDTVEEFRALFPGNHYEYNPGQLVSMTANGLFTNGFNQWDGKVEVGYIHDETGDVTVNRDSLCTDFIRVIPNQKYYINTEQTKGRWGAWYDANKNYIAGIVGYDQVLTAPTNAAYVRLTIKKDDSGNPDTFCLNLSHTGVENGKYEPYWDATKDLSVIQKYFPNGMRSAGSIYDEISFDETTQKWVAIQRVGNVDLGSLSWTYSEHLFSGETVAGFKTSIEDIIFANTATTLPNITVSKYNINTADKVANGYAATETFTGYKAYKTDLSAYFTFTTDASEFKSSLSGVMLNYELAEPIITVIEEPINLSYKVGDFGIEQILSDSFSAPFRADIIYQFNATDRIRENSLNIEKLSKAQNECLLLAGGTMSGQINSQDIKPVEDSTYQLGDSTHKYKNVFSDFFTGNLEGNAKTATVATDLSGRVEATPEEFTYRPSAGEKSIKDDNAFIRRVKGNSVVWNQLSQVFPKDTTKSAYGVSAKTVSGTHYIECSGTTTAIEGDNNLYVDSDITPKINGVSGHKYLFLVEGCENLQINLYSFVSPSVHITNGGTIVTCTKNELLRYSVLIPTSTPVGTTINEKISVLYIDLTQMFGPGNEPTTVEEFRALYPNSYYPYNTGELRNLDCSGIKTVGFNQWDEQWEVGYLNADGTTAGYVQNYIRAKNYIPVISGEKYYAKLPNGVSDAQLFAVDENYNLIKQIYYWINNQFVIPDGAAYIRFYMKYGSEVYNNDICINLSHTGYRDGEYESYKEVTHALPLSQITNGEPLRYVYNSYAGEQYDEINETEYIKRIGVVDLGTLDWSWDEANSVFKTYGLVGNGNAYRFFCSKYTTTNYGFANMADKTIRSTKENLAVLGIKDSSFGTDASALKASLAGVLLNYELAEPIVTPIETPIDFNYYVEDFGTEEALLAEDSAPFSADIVYQFNATDTIRVLEKNIKQLLNKITSLENIITNAITNSNNL